MLMDDETQIGLIGAGGWGHHLGELVRSSENGDLTAIAEIVEETREQAGEALEVEPESRYENIEEMLDSTTLDGVIVTTPHSFHYEHTTLALDRGIGVLCEKPLTIDVEDARDLVRRSEAGDSPTLMVGYQRHVQPAYRTARKELAEEELRFVTATVTQNWIKGQRDTWRTVPDLSGGGQLYDTGQHLLDAVLWITDRKPVSVTASKKYDDDAELVDKQAMFAVTFEDGTIANITVSGDAPRVYEQIKFYGERELTIEGTGWGNREFTIIDSDSIDQTPEMEVPLTDPNSEKINRFLHSIRNNETPPATARDGLRTVAVTEAAYEAARTGKRVDIQL